jgi:RNA polymerase sigma factor (sigma-70 family)
VGEGQSKIVAAFLGYKEVLVRVLLRMSVRPADIDDILQESVTRALRAENRGPLEYPKSYLYTVVRNLVFEERERRGREVQYEINEAILASDSAPVDEELHHAKMLEIFWEAMGSLPRNHQRAILLRRLYGLSHKEVAKKLGVSESSVEKYFAHGIKRCEDLMARRGYGFKDQDLVAEEGDTETCATNAEKRHIDD